MARKPKIEGAVKPAPSPKDNTKTTRSGVVIKFGKNVTLGKGVS